MKRSTKRLAVFVMIAAIAIFIGAATASAFDRDDYPKAIRAQYASTGGGTCFMAVCGFDTKDYPLGYVPNFWTPAGGPWLIMTYTSEAVWKFEHDGKGSVARTNPTVFYQPVGAPGTPWPSAGIGKDSWDFTYVIAKDGKITLTEVPGWHAASWESGLLVGTVNHLKGYNRWGTFAPDGMTITLHGGLPDVITVEGPNCAPGVVTQMICNDSAVLIWQHDLDHK